MEREAITSYSQLHLRYLHRCAYCPKNFATAEMLKAHCSKVHGNAMNAAAKATSYNCKVCSLNFISFSGLSRHQKVKHGIRTGGNEGNHSRQSSPSVVIDVSSTTTPVTLNFPTLASTSSSSSSTFAAPTSTNETLNKSLTEEDFLQEIAQGPPIPMDVGDTMGGGGGGESFKCGSCFLFFDNPTDFSQHRISCG